MAMPLLARPAQNGQASATWGASAATAANANPTARLALVRLDVGDVTIA